MNLKETRNKISKLLLEQREIALKGFTAESRAQFDTMQKDIDALEADAQRLEAIESRSSVYDSNSFERSPRPVVGGQTSTDETRSKINKAFRAYALRGWAGMEAEQRDLLTTSDASGGALIPQLFDGVLQEAKKFYGPVALRVRQKVTDNNGAPMKISLTNDTANGMVLLSTEGTSGPVETDPVFQSRLLGVDTVSAGLVKVSFQELEDLTSAYMLRTDGQPTVLRLQERFADTLEQGFLLFTRIGGASLIATGAPNALATLKLAAS